MRRNGKTLDRPISKITRTLLAFSLLLGLTCSGNAQQESVAAKYSSGDAEIDQIRNELKISPTDESNYVYRASMLDLWHAALQHQGALTAGKYRTVRINTAFINSIQDEETRKEAIGRYAKAIDSVYAILDSIHEELIENPSSGLTPLAPDPDTVVAPVKTDKAWPQYMGSERHIGFNGNDGPVYGRKAWRFPVGLAWESRPVVEGNKVYLASPGLRNILFTLDINTGEVIDSTKQMPNGTYSTPANASTPVVLKDTILLREMGSRGAKGAAKEIVYVSKKTGQVERKCMQGILTTVRVTLRLLRTRDLWFILIRCKISKFLHLKGRHLTISYAKIRERESRLGISMSVRLSRNRFSMAKMCLSEPRVVTCTASKLL